MTRTAPAWCAGFAPLSGAGARVLILGSMPGAASLAAGAYYAHPRNAFWPIMGALFDAGPALPYAERVARLMAARIAVWDVLAACERPGSLDADIVRESVQVNDFATLFAAQPGLTHVFFNGGAAERLFARHVVARPRDPGCAFVRLPSTSPAHAGLDRAAKLAAWSAVAQALRPSR